MPSKLDEAENWRETAGIVPPDGRRFWITEDMITRDKNGAPNPWFGTHTVASVFFGRSAAWLRVRMRPVEGEWPDSQLVLDGKPLEIFRSRGNDRQFSLLDIERAAHALLENGSGSLDRYRFALTIQAVVIAARQRHILKDWQL
jgi:hypothetical protein